MSIPRIQYCNVAHGAPFHAAAAKISMQASKDTLQEVRLHGHDFYEWIVALRGEAWHTVNQESVTMRQGQLVLIRPDDIHSFSPMGSSVFELVNVAFPVSVYDDFVRATGLSDRSEEWKVARLPICVNLLASQAEVLEVEAKEAVRSYHADPSRLAFSQFWRVAAGAFSESDPRFGASLIQPNWLRICLSWAHSVEVSELSLESLVACANVTLAHLSRNMKKHLGVTPTQYINALRVKHAAYELATTSQGIAGIAFDCGFENLSYFYRRFQEVHGKTPGAYRANANRALAPDDFD